MTQPRLDTLGSKWSASIKTLTVAYGQTEDAVAMATYALAEQIHRHYCLARGLVNHSEARPDQHAAISIMMSLAGTDWFLGHRSDFERPTHVLPDRDALIAEPLYVTPDEVDAALDQALVDDKTNPEARAAVLVILEEVPLTEELATRDDQAQG